MAATRWHSSRSPAHNLTLNTRASTWLSLYKIEIRFPCHLSVTRLTEISEYFRNTGPMKNMGIPVKDTYWRNQYWYFGSILIFRKVQRPNGLMRTAKTDSKADLSIHRSHRSYCPKSVFKIFMIPFHQISFIPLFSAASDLDLHCLHWPSCPNI